MKRYYLAVDIGASSGRLFLGCMEDGKIVLEEIYRFSNGMVNNNGILCWDLEALFFHILQGLKKCCELGKIPDTCGIDTWAVDFVLLDRDGSIIGDTAAYRDGRTAGMDRVLSKYITEEELYARTGIQKQPFNTIYQLMAVKRDNPMELEKAEAFLMLPDYFNFKLTGVKRNEYTNATSTALVNAEARTWDKRILNTLNLPARIFGELYMPKISVGHFTKNIKEAVGFDCEVVLPATHDTASAVMAVPMDSGSIYISSGTWSLIGVENTKPNTTEKSRKCNFTNEGGYDCRFRYLKNIMGLWIIQSIKKELGDKYDFPEMSRLAKASGYFSSIIDVNDESLLAPESMITALKALCKRSDQAVPQNEGELLQCVYKSLAKSYGDAVLEIEELTNRKYSAVNIVGGGCRDMYLNELTALYTGKTVYAGPTEATALGNILCQMLRAGEFRDINDARAAVRKSFDITKVEGVLK